MPKKKWVFDAVTLSNFLLADSSFILEKRYRNHGIITWEVYDEVSSGIAEYPELKGITNLFENKTLRVLTLTKTEHQHFLSLLGSLGKGEASCIALAKEQGATVFTDDRSARAVCSRMKIPLSGTVGILKASVQDQQISLTQADEIILKMIKTGYYSPVRSISDIF